MLQGRGWCGFLPTARVRKCTALSGRRRKYSTALDAGVGEEFALCVLHGIKNKWVGLSLWVHPVSVDIAVYEGDTEPWRCGMGDVGSGHGGVGWGILEVFSNLNVSVILCLL